MRPGCGANHTEHKQQNAMRSLCFGIFLMTSMLGLLHGLLTENLLPFSLLSQIGRISFTPCDCVIVNF